ncbi:MAG: DUF58 domain-containing protein [Rhodobacteraceae bacterium]|nr:DUF58 domain-containing protein [Paracoccaceae bacterium]
MGQSLEFRDFRPYVPGDDIRTMDWPATLRSGTRIVRSFEAEERRRLVLLVDCRPAMHLPKGVEKLAVALWITQLLVDIALAERDQAVVVPLFSSPARPPVTVRDGRDRAALRSLVASLRGAPASDAEWSREPDLEGTRIDAVLRPAAAVVLLSDMLFQDAGDRMAALARRAQQSYRSLHVLELDSWPMERAILMEGSFRLGAMEGRSFETAHMDADLDILEQAETAMQAHRLRLRHALSGPGLIWPASPFGWPELPALDPRQVTAWFRAEFARAAVIPSLLSRTSR